MITLVVRLSMMKHAEYVAYVYYYVNIPSSSFLPSLVMKLHGD